MVGVAQARRPDRYLRETIDAATVLGVVGLVLGVLAITGVLNNYVQPFFRPIMLVTSVAFLALAAWSVIAAEQSTAGASDHRHRPMRPAGWLILVPVLIAALAAPDPLGARMIKAQSGAQANPGHERATALSGRNPDGTIAFPPLDAEVNEITLESLANRYSFGDKGRLLGKRVAVIGFGVAGGPGEPPMLARFKIYCCAADALPFQVLLDGSQLGAESPGQAKPRAGVVESDAWYEVTGTVAEGDQDRARLVVEKLHQVAQPERPYL